MVFQRQFAGDELFSERIEAKHSQTEAEQFIYFPRGTAIFVRMQIRVTYGSAVSHCSAKIAKSRKSTIPSLLKSGPGGAGIIIISRILSK